MTPSTARPLLAAVALLATACSTPPESSSSSSSSSSTTISSSSSSSTGNASNHGNATPPREPAEPASIPAPADVAAPPADATRTATGLASRVLSPGSGTEHPTAASDVTVHYTGWTTNGEMFDSSIPRGQPASFPLRGVIPGWTEGLQLMLKGEKRRFWIPVELAYQNRPGAPAGMLVFDVELIDFTTPPPPPPAPSDVARPPTGRACTATGLCSRVIRAGSGSAHPEPTATVTVHYTGWTTNGEMFDSSVVRGRPASFPLNRVIPGWSEGVRLMTVGETRRLWIPESLAYQGRPGAPAGMLVFDVELISIDATP